MSEIMDWCASIDGAIAASAAPANAAPAADAVGSGDGGECQTSDSEDSWVVLNDTGHVPDGDCEPPSLVDLAADDQCCDRQLFSDCDAADCATSVSADHSLQSSADTIVSLSPEHGDIQSAGPFLPPSAGATHERNYHSGLDEYSVLSLDDSLETGDSIADENQLTAADEDQLAAADEDQLAAADEDQLAAADEDQLAAADEDQLAAADEDQLASADEDQLASADEDQLIAADEDQLIAADEDQLAAADAAHGDRLHSVEPTSWSQYDLSDFVLTEEDTVLVTSTTDKTAGAVSDCDQSTDVGSVSVQSLPVLLPGVRIYTHQRNAACNRLLSALLLFSCTCVLALALGHFLGWLHHQQQTASLVNTLDSRLNSLHSDLMTCLVEEDDADLDNKWIQHLLHENRKLQERLSAVEKSTGCSLQPDTVVRAAVVSDVGAPNVPLTNTPAYLSRASAVD